MSVPQNIFVSQYYCNQNDENDRTELQSDIDKNNHCTYFEPNDRPVTFLNFTSLVPLPTKNLLTFHPFSIRLTLLR